MTARGMFYPESKRFSEREEKSFARIDLAFAVTEDLLVAMEDKNVSKAELAKRLGKSKSFVTQVLSGDRNMTLGTLSDIAYALNLKPKFHLGTKEEIELQAGVATLFAELSKNISKFFNESSKEQAVAVKEKARVYPIRSTRIIGEHKESTGRDWAKVQKRAVGCP